MTLSEVARKNSMRRASARRFLLTLQKLGYIIKVDDYFQLTAKILEIEHQYLTNLNYIEVITPFMREVSRKLFKAMFHRELDHPFGVYSQYQNVFCIRLLSPQLLIFLLPDLNSIPALLIQVGNRST